MTVYVVHPGVVGLGTDGPAQNVDDTGAYTMGLQFRIAIPTASVVAIDFWRCPLRYDGVAVPSDPPTRCGVYDSDTHALVSPGEDFTDPGAATGWIRHTLATPVPVDDAHIYKVAVFYPFTGNRHYGSVPHYFDSGVGDDPGLDLGPVHIDGAAQAVGGGGQCTFHATGADLIWPDGEFNATNYCIGFVLDDGAPLSQTLTPEGIASAEAFGIPDVLRGSVELSPEGIASAEQVGTPAVSRGELTLTPVGVMSGEAFGVPTVRHVVPHVPSPDPTLDYRRPDVEALVYQAIRDLGGVTSWAYTANDERTPAGWLTTVSVQVDVRARSKAAAFARADQARRLVCGLPWTTWDQGVVARVDITDGPFWLPDTDGAPRYVARYALTVHPLPALKEGALV